MHSKLNLLKAKIAKLAQNESFIHHKWYVDHHLNLAEKIAFEFCDIYSNADRDMVSALILLHDLGKILTSKTLPREQEDSLTVLESRKILQKLDFPADFTGNVLDNLRLFEKYMERDLANENIEVQIASSADAASHYIGPFTAIYWYENHDKDITWLVESNRQKALRDLKKVVLPEAKKQFLPKILAYIDYQY